MFWLKRININLIVRNIVFIRPVSNFNMHVEHLNKRTILKLSGSDTVDYLQSMITNNMKNIEKSSTIYSLLLNARGKVLYDILLYKIHNEEYLVEYESTAVEYLHQHLFMYRLRKNVDIKPVTDFSAWVIYPELDYSNSVNTEFLETVRNSVMRLDGVVTSIIDPRTNLLGIRVITKRDSNLLNALFQTNFKFIEGKMYRQYRYKLGIGEGVIDHPCGTCLPLETNVDFLNGVSFSKGCYLGQELTARSHFTMNIRKRLMPVILELKDSYPEFPPESSIINDEGEKLGRLRSNLSQFGLALLKYEDSLKAKYLLIKDFDVKLKAVTPIWWPKDINNEN